MAVGDLKKKVAAGEQYFRSNCLKIHGVPEKSTAMRTYLLSLEK